MTTVGKNGQDLWRLVVRAAFAGLAASGVRTLLTLCYTCNIHATMVITTSDEIQTDATYTQIPDIPHWSPCSCHELC